MHAKVLFNHCVQIGNRRFDDFERSRRPLFKNGSGMCFPKRGSKIGLNVLRYAEVFNGPLCMVSTSCELVGNIG